MHSMSAQRVFNQAIINRICSDRCASTMIMMCTCSAPYLLVRPRCISTPEQDDGSPSNQPDNLFNASAYYELPFLLAP